jgi:hypothetical protein
MDIKEGNALDADFALGLNMCLPFMGLVTFIIV